MDCINLKNNQNRMKIVFLKCKWLEGCNWTIRNVIILSNFNLEKICIIRRHWMINKWVSARSWQNDKKTYFFSTWSDQTYWHGTNTFVLFFSLNNLSNVFLRYFLKKKKHFTLDKFAIILHQKKKMKRKWKELFKIHLISFNWKCEYIIDTNNQVCLNGMRMSEMGEF